eukprot:CAMPEP_0194350044 /NCGR_PEP_ID=MMETSP0171-20130528/107422_1 /TAXON_ID=218684 /ORGANISM="Corethron pennatum, Strain L29A3" /LENGTH=615 /DNA_ID=CAMNT_0039117555 /DNA_START=251 /DNA_END=2096 /DNA_ORIENTATION=-
MASSRSGDDNEKKKTRIEYYREYFSRIFSRKSSLYPDAPHLSFVPSIWVDEEVLPPEASQPPPSVHLENHRHRRPVISREGAVPPLECAVKSRVREDGFLPRGVEEDRKKKVICVQHPRDFLTWIHNRFLPSETSEGLRDLQKKSASFARRLFRSRPNPSFAPPIWVDEEVLPPPASAAARPPGRAVVLYEVEVFSPLLKWHRSRRHADAYPHWIRAHGRTLPKSNNNDFVEEVCPVVPHIYAGDARQRNGDWDWEYDSVWEIDIGRLRQMEIHARRCPGAAAVADPGEAPADQGGWEYGTELDRFFDPARMTRGTCRWSDRVRRRRWMRGVSWVEKKERDTDKTVKKKETDNDKKKTLLPFGKNALRSQNRTNIDHLPPVDAGAKKIQILNRLQEDLQGGAVFPCTASRARKLLDSHNIPGTDASRHMQVEDRVRRRRWMRGVSWVEKKERDTDKTVAKKERDNEKTPLLDTGKKKTLLPFGSFSKNTLRSQNGSNIDHLPPVDTSAKKFQILDRLQEDLQEGAVFPRTASSARKLLDSHNIPFDGETYAAAAANGNVELVRWLRSSGCPMDVRGHGSIHALVRETCGRVGAAACVTAARGGKLSVLRSVRARG